MVKMLEPQAHYIVEYPQAVALAEEQNKILWFSSEIKVEKDVQSIRTEMTETEKHGVLTTLKLFTKYECVDVLTEVLTPRGWKFIGDVSDEDMIAQWNPDNFEVTFTRPTRIFSKYYSGDMVKIYDDWRGVNQLVTPNHRLPYKTPAIPHYRFAEAGDMKFHQFKSHPVSGYSRGTKKMLSFEERFLVASQADGSIMRADIDNYRAKLGGYSVKFGLTKQRKRKRLEWILSNLGWQYDKVEVPASGNRKPSCRYRVVVPREVVSGWDCFKNLDQWVDLSSVDSEWCNQFLDEVAEWDGSRIKDRDTVDYRTTCKNNADVVQAVVALAGQVGTIRVQEDNRSSAFSDVYYIRYRKQSEKNGQHIKKELVKYDGMVYCPTVPTGAFLIRREDVVGITGNCIVGDDYWQQLGSYIKKPACIGRMASTYQFVEKAIHSPFYAQINEALGIANETFYSEYINDPLLSERVAFLEEYANIEKHGLDNFLTVLALTEGAVLYSSFAYLKHFQSNGKNKIPNVVAGINFSVRDESLHSAASSWLYNQLREEGGVSNEQMVPELAETVRQHEHAIVDKIFEKGAVEGITATQMKNFVDSRVDLVLRQLGYKPMYNPSHNPVAEWFYKSINDYVANDFFVRTGREYTRGRNEEEFVI